MPHTVGFVDPNIILTVTRGRFNLVDETSRPRQLPLLAKSLSVSPSRHTTLVARDDPARISLATSLLESPSQCHPASRLYDDLGMLYAHATRSATTRPLQDIAVLVPSALCWDLCDDSCPAMLYLFVCQMSPRLLPAIYG